MKKLIQYMLLTLFISIFTVDTLSQEANSDFLNSLPDDVKKTILENGADEGYDENIYVSDSSKIKKAELELSRLIRDAKKLEETLNNSQEKSPLLTRFGSEIFSTYQTTFMPINEVNTDNTYVLDVGDGLRLQILGDLSSDTKLRVGRDGSINIPDVGKVYVAGLELNKVNEMIQKLISTSFLGNTAYITLDEIRSIKIYILGNVPNPGMYTLNGNSNIIHAISVAGGISDNGSYRDIELKRNGDLIGITDLYSTLVFGDTSSNYSLRSGDVVLVKSSHNLISISGAVSRPAIYELKNGESLGDILILSGGLTGDFLDTHVEVARTQDISSKKVFKKSFNEFKLRHNDRVSVPFFKPELKAIKTATISGAVQFPGTYNISDNEMLTTLVSMAGGYLKSAYPYAGLLKREGALKKGNDFKNKEYGNLIKFLIAGSNGAQAKAGMMTADSTSELLEEIRNYQDSNSGRFTIEFDLDKIDRDPSQNTQIQDGDSIHIPEFSNEVYLFGELNNPGTRSYVVGATPEEYIDIAGGIAQNAYPDGIIVIDPNGNARVLRNTSLFDLMKDSNKIDIYPHSVIFVPRDISKLDTLTRSSYIAQIASAAILPVLTLLSLNNDSGTTTIIEKLAPDSD